MQRTAIDLDLNLHRPLKPEDFWNYPRDKDLRRAIDCLRHGGPDRISILFGEHGTGKTSLARFYGMWASCGAHDSGGMPCGICDECHVVQNGMNNWRGRYVELDGSSDTIVDEVCDAFRNLYGYGRNVLGTLNKSTSSSRHNGKPGVLFIDEAHRMSDRSQHKLLKLCEKDGGVCIVFATTKPDKIDLGLKDRADGLYYLSHPDPEESVHHLRLIAGENRGSATEAAAMLIVEQFGPTARKCKGTLGKLMRHNRNVDEAFFIEMFGKPHKGVSVPDTA